MLQDYVTSHIGSDEMICTYVDASYARKGCEQSQQRYIAQKIRELGQFVLAAKEIDRHVQKLRDICDPTKFELSIKQPGGVKLPYRCNRSLLEEI